MRKIKSLLLVFLIILASGLPIIKIVDAQTQSSVSLDPSTISATKLNDIFTLNITISNVQNLYGWAVNLTWDSHFLTLTNKQEGNFLSDQVGGSQFAPLPVLDINYTQNEKETGDNIGMKCLKLSCSASTSSNGIQDSASGSGVLATVTFKVIKQTQSTSVTLSVENLLKPNLVPADSAVYGPHELITPLSNYAVTHVSLIIPGPPTANAGREQTVQTGAQVILNASQSVSTGNNTAYLWTFVDGTPQNLTGKIANYTFNNPGNYTVNLTVQDSLGTDNCSTIIHVLGDSLSAAPDPTSTPNSDSNSTPTPTATDSTSTSDPGSTKETASFNIPPTITGIIVVLTVFVFGGSFFWLRKRT